MSSPFSPSDPDIDSQTARDDMGARSLTGAVYAKVRTDIITNRLEQNEKLHIATLQERFKVSLSVIREALSRLVADGLVVAEAQRGFRVSPISKKDLIDVTRTRIGIETMALQIAIERGDAAWARDVDAAFAAMLATDRTAQKMRWADRHADFHRVLLRPCDSAWLLRFRDILFEQSERYRFLYDSVDNASGTPVKRDVDAEHRALLDAVLQRRPDAAKAALEDHFSTTMTGVLSITQLD